jgi:nitronate monooxygenase
MLAMLLEVAPPVLSFHFGLPTVDVITELRERGILLFATATSPEEARADVSRALRAARQLSAQNSG